MGIREVMVIVGGKSVGDVVELLGDGSAFRAGPDLPLPARGAGHRPRDRAGPRLRRRRGVLLRPRRQHPARRQPLTDVAREFETGRTAPARCSTGSRIRSASGWPSWTPTGNVIGFEEKPEQPKSDLIPIGVYFLRPDAFDVIDHLAPSGRGEFEITDVLNHYIPDRRPVHPGLRGPLDRRRDGPVAPARGRAGRRRTTRAGRLPPPATRPAAERHGRRPVAPTGCWSPVAPGSSARATSATCWPARRDARSRSSTS